MLKSFINDNVIKCNTFAFECFKHFVLNKFKILSREGLGPKSIFTCGQPMRIPRGLGTVQITCRNCQAQFEAKS